MAGPDLSPLIQAYQNKGALTRAKAAAPVDNFLNSYGKARANRRAESALTLQQGASARADRAEARLASQEDRDSEVFDIGGVMATRQQHMDLVNIAKMQLENETRKREIANDRYILALANNANLGKGDGNLVALDDPRLNDADFEVGRSLSSDK
jgi:hypothetical protein